MRSARSSEQIRTALQSVSDEIVKQALDQLLDSHEPAEEFRDDLLRLRYAEDEMIRSDAIELLRDCLQPEDRDWLLEAIEDPEDIVQLAAVRHAGKVFGPEHS